MREFTGKPDDETEYRRWLREHYPKGLVVSLNSRPGTLHRATCESIQYPLESKGSGQNRRSPKVCFEGPDQLDEWITSNGINRYDLKRCTKRDCDPPPP